MVTLSSTEAEYIAMCAGAQECIGLSIVLKDLGLEVEQILLMGRHPHLAESKAVAQRSRHINIKYFGYAGRWSKMPFVLSIAQLAKWSLITLRSHLGQ